MKRKLAKAWLVVVVTTIFGLYAKLIIKDPKFFMPLLGFCVFVFATGWAIAVVNREGEK